MPHVNLLFLHDVAAPRKTYHDEEPWLCGRIQSQTLHKDLNIDDEGGGYFSTTRQAGIQQTIVALLFLDVQ